MKDLGVIKNCLGIKFSRDKNRAIYLKRSSNIKKLLKLYNMENCKPISTPIESNSTLSKPKIKNVDLMSKVPYQNLIGSLLYLSISTRPDIAYAVNFLSQFNTNYNLEHWKAAKRILRYLKGTINYGLKFEKTNERLFGLADADWGSNKVDRKSFSGYAFIMSGAPISWVARKQKTVSLSSTEAEYLSMSEATKEILYLKDLFDCVNFKIEPIVLFNDNQSAIKLVKNDVFHARTKHIDVRHHFIRNAEKDGIIDVKYMPSEEMAADVLTKGLPKMKHFYCLKKLGMFNIN